MVRQSDSRSPVLLWAVVLAAVGALALPLAAEAPSTVLPPLMDRETVRAIDRGLTYLANTQRRDGSWSASGQYEEYPEVMTSLAALAMLANGSTPETGPYAKNVTKAMDYLIALGEGGPDGLIASGGRSMYGHGFAMLFLAQCYGMELDQDTEKRLHKVLTKGIELTAKSQSKMNSRFGKPCGGWYYSPGSNSDEGSVTVTQLQALRACRTAGIHVPRVTIDNAVEYLRHCQMPDGGICYSAAQRSDSRPAISAAAIACFYAAGLYDRQAGGAGPETVMVDQLVQYVKKSVRPDDANAGWGGHYFYTHFYMASAMYQRGGEDWTEYYKTMKVRLLRTQTDGDGSWTGQGGVGVTFDTAVATMILQLPYGYLPIWQR
ncbi:MAG: prenyltransferase/squalene oxidase repeat-containing protein [Planctomycetota bacterium]